MRRIICKARRWRILGFWLALSASANAEGLRVESSVGSTILAQDGTWFRSLSVTSGLGYAFPQAAFGVELGLNAWTSARVRRPGAEWLDALTVGAWAEYQPLGHITRSRVGAGFSRVLLGPSEDPPQHAGGYWVDLRPLGLRFRLSPHGRAVLDPLTFTCLMADPLGIPLADIQLSTRLAIEVFP